MTEFVVVNVPVEPGTRCGGCHRRVNKPRTDSSPKSKRVGASLPIDRAEFVNEALDSLQEYARMDDESYPRGVLIEHMAAFCIQHREEFRRDYLESRS